MIGILGGGIAALSLAYFLERDSVIFEKEQNVGGLCRSFVFEQITYDIGPHIIFSKHQHVLDLHNSMTEVVQHRRMNRILHNNSFVNYPFENFLGQLKSESRDKCLTEFLNNPYKTIKDTNNMQQFFLSKFGEGMTEEYFSPYNKKIWKLDPSFLDTQMVERIPSPPVADVINGANGQYAEGYLHQLFFTYPKTGGFQSIVDAYSEALLAKGTDFSIGSAVTKIQHRGNGWDVTTLSGTRQVDQIVSTIPLPHLPRILEPENLEINKLADEMLYNSIHIVILRYKGDLLSDQFALYVPDETVIFHRLTRLNFLGEEYGEGSGSVYFMVEITFRPNSYLANLTHPQIIERCVEDLNRITLADKKDFISGEVRTFEHAYVIYDLNHRERTDELLNWAQGHGIICHGRFGKFEYQNSDQVVADSISLANEINVAK
jgi:protoporphyrinogen oxidase